MATAAANTEAMGVRPWGGFAAIDLRDCDCDRLADGRVIADFLAELVPAIGMEAHGPVHLDRFGDGALEGWSAMQFIKTSTVTVHADEVGGRCFIDIFSCKTFDADRASQIATGYFRGIATVRTLARG